MQQNTQDVLTSQVVVWEANPFANLVDLESSGVSVTSRVLTVSLFSGGRPLVVEALSPPLQLRMGDGVPMGDSLMGGCNLNKSCVDLYDVAHGDGACDRLVVDFGYTCEDHFCESCKHVHFCDRSCRFDHGCNRTLSPNTSQCTLASELLCSYWDKTQDYWRVDGVLVDSGRNQSVCSFTHLTDFALVLGPAPQGNRLAPLSETLDIGDFMEQNSAGLIVVVVLFAAVCSVCSANLMYYSKRNGMLRNWYRGTVLTHVQASTTLITDYALSVRAATKQPHLVLLKFYRQTLFRTQWSCIGIFWPLAGDPHKRTERLLVLGSQVLLNLVSNMIIASLW